MLRQSLNLCFYSGCLLGMVVSISFGAQNEPNVAGQRTFLEFLMNLRHAILYAFFLLVLASMGSVRMTDAYNKISVVITMIIAVIMWTFSSHLGAWRITCTRIVIIIIIVMNTGGLKVYDRGKGDIELEHVVDRNWLCITSKIVMQC